jgi:formylmethanofuran dehydrogenase subunit E
VSKSKAANHLHRYLRVNLGRNGKEYFIYRCTKPLCSHYIPVNMSLNVMCECNRCGEPMIIDRVILFSNKNAMKRPHCSSCIKKKQAPNNLEELARFLKGT